MLLAAILVGQTGCLLHRGQPVIAVTEEQFRFETKRNDAFVPVPLPLTKPDSDNLEKFLIAGGNQSNINGSTSADPAAAREYRELIASLRDNTWTYEQILDQHALRKWFPKIQVGGVVDARLDTPPRTPPLAGKSGPYWWIFYIRGHDVTGLMVFKAAVSPPQPRSKN